MTARAHAIFSGKVQGVFFRATTQRKAIDMVLKGWVRNLPNGTVEAVFEGPAERINETIEWLKKKPKYARVTDVQLNWQEFKNEFKDFEIRY